MKKNVDKIMKQIKYFRKENKMLFQLSLCAMVYILLYMLSYNKVEMGERVRLLIDISFQLSLAIIANLLFFIFQVYIPTTERQQRVHPLIIDKIRDICENMNQPFQFITEMYLEKKKDLDKLSEEDIQNIANEYRANEKIDVVEIGQPHDWTVYSFFLYCFNQMDNTVQELLFTYEPYLMSDERDTLLMVKENLFRHLIENWMPVYFNTKGIRGNAVGGIFKQYIFIYKRLLNLIKEK